MGTVDADLAESVDHCGTAFTHAPDQPISPNGNHSEAIRFPNVIVWFGLGGHELRLAAGEMGVVRL
ncbi:hypothetical protein, partial [Streptomyces mirabilis]|uniref:hypothetical protein n=1 Tax=Streptomyces mirabilis TaxID=68239 RepID=UPI0033CBC7C0